VVLLRYYCGAIVVLLYYSDTTSFSRLAVAVSRVHLLSQLRHQFQLHRTAMIVRGSANSHFIPLPGRTVEIVPNAVVSSIVTSIAYPRATWARCQLYYELICPILSRLHVTGIPVLATVRLISATRNVCSSSPRALALLWGLCVARV
jgi:hypothetical protein